MSAEETHPAVAAQRRAADPAGSAWVAANAGSGKTRVLTERVARLLLEGARPEKILCLTYTKAAAAEMRSRLFGMLGGWAMEEDDKLDEALRALTGGRAPGDLSRARRLFAEALETPGGLKIQTIHAFCDSILRRFPLEAGAPPGFRVMEERERAALIEDVLTGMAAGSVGELAAISAIAAEKNEGGIGELAAIAAARPALFPDPADEAGLCAAFGVPNPPNEAAAVAAALDRLDRPGMARMIAAWRHGAPGDQNKAAALAAAVETGGAALGQALESALLKKAGGPVMRLATKGAQAAEPDWEALCERLVAAALAVREARLAAAAADRAIRLGRFGAAFSRAYEAAKAARSLLDFNDLVGRARALLTCSEMAAWALYRLDGGVDHILVDEAQDTSPEQWDVIDAIAAEFRAGAGARADRRTSFVVGDEKQSIYSFQGAAPGMFETMRARFAAGLEPVGGLREEALEASFRSAPAILEAVDATFAADRAEGLTARGAPPRHAAFFERRAGRVELWPLTPPDPKAEPPAAWSPVDMPGRRDARVKLAEAVAAHVAALCKGARLPGTGRLVAPGDIVILLRKRAPMMAPLVRELKARGVPVAGADRLELADALAVRDLLALMRFAVTPDDDLTLAALLRSPLFDVDEGALFALAHRREGTLWRALQAAAARWPREVKLLAQATRDADFLRPYEFLEKALLTPDGPGRDGRRRLIARLGRDAEDPIDELLAQALAYEETEIPSIEGFLGWLASGNVAIKREQAPARSEVRVMSAHGAKGLQAPIVILPDTTGKLGAQRPDPVAELMTEAGPRAVWRGAKGDEPAALSRRREEEAAADAAEHRRLLYVAMTRAEDWLIIAGAGEDDPDKLAETWYGQVREGLSSLGARESAAPTGAGETLVHEGVGDGKTSGGALSAEAAPPEAEGWMDTPPPATLARGALRRRSASSLGPVEIAGGVGLGAEVSRLRGVAIHAAFEHEPADLEAFRRLVVADCPPDMFDDAALAALLEEARRARGAPGARRFFEPEAVAEAAVSVEIGGARVAGRIDRLVVGADEVAFVDFKSDAIPPAAAAEIPAAYLTQLAVYREALRGIYPRRRVTAHILWTAAARLDPLTSPALDAALAALRPEEAAS